MKEIPEHLTVRKSFRKSKASFKEVIGGREFFISQTKSNKMVIEVYDINTGILVVVSGSDMDNTKAWIKLNIDRINERLSEYEYVEPSLFS